MLFDWLVTGQILPSNPAHAVRGPRHSVSKGATPVLSSEEAFDVEHRSNNLSTVSFNLSRPARPVSVNLSTISR
jgi:integrase/recombinase XerD